MGIVIRQSILTTIISYAGVALGYVNLLYLYPRFLEPDQVGLLRVIQDAAILLASFAQAGLGQTIVRFYPQLGKDRHSSQGFINLILVMATAAFGIFTILFFGFNTAILNSFGERGEVLQHYAGLILWLTLFMVVITLMESYARVLLKLSIPNFLREIGVRFLQGILVILYFLHVFSFDQFILWSVIIYLIILVTLILYLFITGELHLDFHLIRIPKTKIRELTKFGLLSLLGVGAILIIGKLDSLMVTALLPDGFGQNAIYTTAFYMATVIEIPRRAVSQVSTLLLSQAFEKNDLKEVHSVYHKTTINQLAIGCLLFIGLWGNLHGIFELMPRQEVYIQGYYVVIIIGLVKLMDMAFGPNGETLTMSNYYWVHTIILFSMIGVTVVLNFWLIPRAGIEGAALATMGTYVIFNFIKSAFLYHKFTLLPVSRGTIKIMGIAILVAFVNWLLPQLDSIFLDIFYRSAIITVLYVSLILILRPSEEINMLFRKALKRINF